MRTTSRSGPDAPTVIAARAGDPDALDDLVAGVAAAGLQHRRPGTRRPRRRRRRRAGDAAAGRAAPARAARPVGLPVLAGRDRHPAAARPRAGPGDRAHPRRRARRRARACPTRRPTSPRVTILRLGLTDQRREVAEATRWLDPDDRTLLALWWLEETGRPRPRRAGRRARPVQPARRRPGPADEGDSCRPPGSVVRALAGQPGCRGPLPPHPAAGTASPTPLWRKRIARHVRDCRRCARAAAGLSRSTGCWPACRCCRSRSG